MAKILNDQNRIEEIKTSLFMSLQLDYCLLLRYYHYLTAMAVVGLGLVATCGRLSTSVPIFRHTT